MSGVRHPAPSTWLWLAAALIMLGEFLLFDRMTSRHHASVYPRWNDQIQYLSEAYRAYEVARHDGFLAGIRSTFEKTALQGSLHDLAALFVFKIAGSASRSAALSLNMLAFLAWQACVLAVVPRVTGSRLLGWLGFALLPCLAWPWAADAGSAVDFRLDHAAMCLFGITGLVALLTNGFRHFGWTLAFGAAVGITLLERFLTGAYFAAVFLGAAAWILCHRDRWPRLRNLLAAGIVCTVLAAPAFWANRMAIYNYYWVGHVTGAEGDARDSGMKLLASARFVLGHLGDMHLGAWFGGVAAAVTLVLAFLWAVGPRKKASDAASPDMFFPSLLFLLAPVAILSLHRQKSAYVLGVIAPGVVMLLIWLWQRLWCRLDYSSGSSARRAVPVILGLTALAAGQVFFISRQLRDPHREGFATDARRINELTDYIYRSARQGGLTNPVIGVDQVVDFVDAQILGVVCYERHKVWFSFVTQLPNSILAEPDDVIFYKLKLCDFMILTDTMQGNGHWPYDQQMRRLYPQLKEWCEANRHRSLSVHAFGREMSLYQRREIP